MEIHRYVRCFLMRSGYVIYAYLVLALGKGDREAREGVVCGLYRKKVDRESWAYISEISHT